LEFFINLWMIYSGYNGYTFLLKFLLTKYLNGMITLGKLAFLEKIRKVALVMHINNKTRGY